MKSSSINCLKIEFQRNFFLILILLITSFLRLWGIWRLNFFTYDQARDALFIKRILVDHKFRLIGTQTSIPGVYTPPVYYYLMAPFLAIFRLNPVGIDFATAALNISAVFLMYVCLIRLTKNRLVSLLFTALYSFHPILVQQSRFAWNPNTMPFFSLAAVWSLIKVFENPNSIFPYLLLFFSLGMNVNLHYSGIIFAFNVFLVMLLFLRKKLLRKGIVLGVIIFFLEIVPIFLFDIRHEFLITKNVIRYLQFGTQGSVLPPPFLIGIWQKFSFLQELIFGKFATNLFFNLTFLVFLLTLLIKKSKDQEFKVILSLFFLNLIFSSIYKGSFFPFYLTPFYPFPFLIYGKIISSFSKKRIFFLTSLGFILFFCYQHLNSSFGILRSSQESHYKRLMNIARFLSGKVEENFNLASYYNSLDRYDRNAVDYRYFLEAFFRKTALDWDPIDYKRATNLYFISQAKDVDPLKVNIWEIQTFEPTKVNERWEVEDVAIFYLVK